MIRVPMSTTEYPSTIPDKDWTPQLEELAKECAAFSPLLAHYWTQGIPDEREKLKRILLNTERAFLGIPTI